MRQAADFQGVDTIVAVSTPPGRGGIGIVRLSGPDALSIVARLVRVAGPLQSSRPRLGAVVDADAPDAGPLDEALVTAFLAPRSYTGEDVVEIAAHGSPVVLDALLRGALQSGARLARPGEFTERAFLSGRLDLTEAEAVQNLIASQTLEQVRQAASQLGGAIAHRVAPPKEHLLTLIALLEAGMDFASGELDDVDVVSVEAIQSALEAIKVPLATLAATFHRGQMLRSGASLALVGRPNAGKSSLFNRLLQRDRAIVTALPGTTRDTVEESWSLAGIPLRLVDTAGLRLGGDAPADAAEAQGISRSREALADADLVLVVLDSSLPVEEDERRLVQSLAGRSFLVVGNKVDLLPGPPGADHSTLGAAEVLKVSALTGEGFPDLHAAILQKLQVAGGAVDAGALNTKRQHLAVTDTLAALNAASKANNCSVPHEVLLLDLHAARRALDSLTGETTPDDILGRIFSTFCIGK